MHPLDELKGWVGFGPEDEARLAALWPLVEPEIERVLDGFYAPVLAMARSRAVLAHESEVGRLRKTLRVWLEEMLRGPFDDAYYERRTRIGRVHVHVGLPSRFMPVAMSVVRNELAAIAHRALPAEAAAATVGSVERISGIDLAIMTSTYVEEREVVELAALRDLIVSHMPATVLVVEREGRIAAATRPASKLSAGSVIGRMWDEVVPAALIEAADLHGQLERATLTRRDITLLRVDAEIDGEMRSYRVTVVPLEHELAGALIHLEDLTEAVDTEARLRRAESMARLGEMSAAVAHEMRNPLAGVSGALQIIARGLPPGDPRLPVMDKIQEQIYRLNALVSDLLAFARPGLPRAGPVDLADAVRRAVEAAGKVLPGPVYLVDGAGRAWADVGHVDQILHQVIENAAQASPGGRVRITVADGEVAVHDDGLGVPEADRARIFEPFFTTRTRGTGLGLPIAQRMALAMSGDLVLEEHAGRGARFVLRLPRVADPTRG